MTLNRKMHIARRRIAARCTAVETARYCYWPPDELLPLLPDEPREEPWLGPF
jgi:hypothetical protein